MFAFYPCPKYMPEEICTIFFFWQKKFQDSLVLTLLLALELVQAYKNKSKQGKKKYKVYGLKRKSTKEEFDVGVMFCA